MLEKNFVQKAVLTFSGLERKVPHIVLINKIWGTVDFETWLGAVERWGSNEAITRVIECLASGFEPPQYIIIRVTPNNQL